MIPFQDLVAALDRYKLSKPATAGAPPAPKGAANKPSQPGGKRPPGADVKDRDVRSES